MIKVDGQIDFQDGKGVFSHMHIAERTGFTLRVASALIQYRFRNDWFPARYTERIEDNDFRGNRN